MKITVPEGGPGFGLLEFALHVLDHSPVYETRAQMRSGYKALDVIEAAVKAGAKEIELDDDVGRLFQSATEQTKIPVLFTIINGVQGDPVPKRFFTQFYEAIENADG